MADFDPDAYLSQSPGQRDAGFDPDAWLQEKAQQQSDVSALPAGVVTGPTGVGKVAKQFSPLYEAGKDVLGGYAKSPAKAIVDVGAAHLGIPPPYATAGTAKGLWNVGKGAMESAGNITKMASSIPWEQLSEIDPVTGASKVKPGMFPEVAQAYRELRAVSPADFAKQMQMALQQGGDNAIKNLVQNAPAAVKATPGFIEQAQKYLKALPSPMQQVARVAGPVLKSALKVAGPAAIGYDVYQAGQMARETELGPRLAAGQGQAAEYAFRNLNQNYGPAVDKVQAINILRSGSERDIDAFGGRAKLMQIANQ